MYRYRLWWRQYRRWFVVPLVVLLVLAILIGSAWWWYESHKPVINSFNSCAMAGNPVSQSDPQTCSANHHTYVGPRSSASSDTTGPSGVEQSYQILSQGDSHGTYPRQFSVITTQAAWSALWSQLFAHVSPRPPLLPVDFSSNEVIAMVQGVEPNAGYALQLSGVMADGQTLAVDYEEIDPGSCKEAPQPTDYYVLAETAKTATSPSFQSTKSTRRC